MGGPGRLRAGSRRPFQQGSRGCVLLGIRRRALGRLRAAAFFPRTLAKENRARAGEHQSAGARIERRPQAPHRRGGEIRSAGKPVPEPAVRLREHVPRKPGPGSNATAQTGARGRGGGGGDRKSTRLNSSHTVISYAVFCLKQKK